LTKAYVGYSLWRMDIPEQGVTIAQAAKTLGVSAKTIRRHIKDGKIPHVLVQGKFGEEYRILDLPSIKVETLDTSGEDKATMESEPSADSASQAESNTSWAVDLINDLQKTNLQLAGQLGAAQERIRELESQVMLLATRREPWWKRTLKKLGIK
jgi:MerR family transcriptional regulator, copper efflux regulator